MPSSHSVWTPIESSTSRMRLTSSIRARLRSVVVPLLSREAHSRATAAFLLVLTSMAPESGRPPSIRRWTAPSTPDFAKETNSVSSASLIFASESRVRFCFPDSIRVTAPWLVSSTAASSDWDMPRLTRASRIREPMRFR